MTIENATSKDISVILELYDHAIAYQEKMDAVPWPRFSPNIIKKEINASQHWKLIINNQIACVWLTAFDDPYIWEEKNRDPSLYIHRIATHPNFRGNHFVLDIIAWTRNIAIKNNKKFIRMDIAGNNKKLASYYTKCGFTFLGSNILDNTVNLPTHYHDTPVCLFEMEVH